MLVEPGFYKIVGTNIYKQCDSTGCNEVTLETECKTSTIGQLFTKNEQVALCLNFFDNKPLWTYATATGKYFLKYHATNNIFGLSNDQYGLIKITQNSIILSEESKGKFLCCNIPIYSFQYFYTYEFSLNKKIKKKKKKKLIKGKQQKKKRN